MPRGVKLDPEVRAVRVAEIEKQRTARKALKEQKKLSKLAEKKETKKVIPRSMEEISETIVGVFGLDLNGSFVSKLKLIKELDVVSGSIEAILSRSPKMIFCADSADVLAIDAHDSAIGVIVAFASIDLNHLSDLELTKNVWPIQFGTIPGEGLVLGGTRSFSSIISPYMRKLFGTNEITKVKLPIMAIAQLAKKEADRAKFCLQFDKDGAEALELLGESK